MAGIHVAEYEMLFGAGADEPFPLDNEMLHGSGRGASESGSGSGTGTGGRARAPPPPKDFISPEIANAVLRRGPEPITDVYAISTSCDESTDDEEEDEDADRSAPPRAAEGGGVGSSELAFLDSAERRACSFDREIEEVEDAAPVADRDEPAVASTRSPPPRRRKTPHRPTNGFECFGCSISMTGTAGASDASIDGNKMQGLVRLFTNICATMSQWAVARMCHAYYKDQIYNECRRRGARVPMWHTCQIYEHFFRHINSPEVYLLNQISQYAQLSDMLYGMTASRVEGGSGVEAQLPIIALKLRVDDYMRKLQREDVTTFAFHNPNVSVDLSHAGAHIPPHRAFRAE
jgi:hypothetical protein